ncbi:MULTISPECIES: type II toxin-antitoxin system MqsR family toxin [unclassified Enterobacter]|uniref:type II toxin-antitoxin system MqsR family toxin n=1 Tax=unclassified Enterobacter TaxID=2608935 RepID=UPI0008E122C5|nr:MULTISPECIES: type II toxin-antitoxin system MqsR family toxin [unclassified Enterobacter]SFR07091.1 motility quorum-sensing regulator / GCU-specific mRNA interferase toxin [Enterobacter sp. kpr-6]
MTEKGTAHTRLNVVKALVREGKARTTVTALNDAAALGFCSRKEMFDVVLALETRDFFKSMTAYDDHTCWHEVYRPVYRGQRIYMKFIVQDGVLIVSFKEL